ncbi:MAG: hypothetical protein N839_0005755 [Desulfofustis sp. PB-SRB1]|jgi:hypothetical protein|nr:hypothetical protein [Desulfofustis sp. PB-SRB1]MBM1001902.1 hypothetical protein [Desulfofustis sp. PB-SRB1]HBH27293.1 hypothetical protein [Desulfofustis sp.]HBH31761.1 hypothetical protein [Desulfofustis sp.]
MKQKELIEICDGCSAQEPLTDHAGNEFCRRCLDLVHLLEEHPDLLSRLTALTGVADNSVEKTSTADSHAHHEAIPEVLDAVRYRTHDRERNSWYVSVSEINGDPVEIFASTAFDRDHHLQSRISNLTTITRLISLILRNVYLAEGLTLQKVLKQLARSSRQKNDLPDMLCQVLSNYRTKTSREKTVA